MNLHLCREVLGVSALVLPTAVSETGLAIRDDLFPRQDVCACVMKSHL